MKDSYKRKSYRNAGRHKNRLKADRKMRGMKLADKRARCKHERDGAI